MIFSWFPPKSWEALPHTPCVWDLCWTGSCPPGQLQEICSPAAPTALGLPGPGMQVRGGDRRQRLGPGSCVMARSGAPPPPGPPPGVFQGQGQCPSLPPLSFSQPSPSSGSLLWPILLATDVLIFALLNCWNTVTFLKSSRWKLQATPTTPIPAPPYPTLLDSTFFSKMAFGSLEV